MSKIKNLTGLLSISLAVFCISTSVAKSEIPPRCMHAIAASTANFGLLVAHQLTELDGKKDIGLAHDSIVLTEELRCPKDKTLKSIDCIVAFVHSTNKAPEATDVAQCVIEATGQTLFKTK